MSKLYTLTGQFLALSELADDPDMPEGALADSLEGIAGEIELKAEALLQVVANMDGDIAAINSEIDRLKRRMSVIENRKISLREYLQRNMEASGISKIDCPLFSITLAKPRPMAVIENESLVPAEFVQTKTLTSVNKKTVLDALKAGRVIPGCALGESRRSLTIR